MSGIWLGGADLTANAWRQVVQGSAVPGYGDRYRRWVLDSLRYVDVPDLATGGDHIPELSDVYVDVALVSRAPHQVSANPLGRVARTPRSGTRSASSSIAARAWSSRSSARREAGRAPCLPTRPGAAPGRSYSGTRAAGASPFCSRCVSTPASIVADPAISLPAVARAAVGGAAGREPDGWWERQLRRGRCLVLLDGLDEVARDDDRLAVAEWAERQIAAYAGNHFVITARPHGLPGQLAAQADVLAVRPFTAEQVQLFLDRWYLAPERHATGASGDPRARRAYPGRRVRRAAHLTAPGPSGPVRPAVNPLLLTMIAMAHPYRARCQPAAPTSTGRSARSCFPARAGQGPARGCFVARPNRDSWPHSPTR